MVVGALLLGQYTFAGLMLLIMVAMMYEFYHIAMNGKYVWPRLIATLEAVTVFVLTFLICAFGIDPRYMVIAIIPLAVLMGYALFLKDKSEFGLFSHLYTALIYIAVPIILSNFLVFRNMQYNGLLILCFFIIIWSSDVGAYLFGMALGQKYGKKLCPSISPKKSWIGFWGGMFMAVAAALIMKYTGFMPFPAVHAVALAVVMNVAGVGGDLFESQWKRFYEVKDSGNIIPGHGGMLDRFDSTLLALPVGIAYLVLFNLI